MKPVPTLSATLCAALMAVALPSLSWAQDSFGGAGAPASGQGGQPMPSGRGPGGPIGSGPTSAAPGQPTANSQEAELARMEPLERKDMGVPATATLHDGQMHGPTPTSIPGARLVTTREIYDMVRRAPGERSTAPRSFDILGGPDRLPGALLAVPAGQPGHFDDAAQREFGQFLNSVKQGRKDLPMIFYCASTHCWMSYNAALRATKLGYTHVLWYRGGIEAWKHARMPMQPADGQQGQQGQQGQNQGQGPGPLGRPSLGQQGTTATFPPGPNPPR